MVWSDQSQFPFYVIDNNGNIILTIDSTGLHLVGTNGEIDAIVSGGNPIIQFWNAAHTSVSFIRLTIPPDSNGITINAPDGLGGFSMVKVNQNGVFLGDINNPNIVNQVQYLNSDGFLRLSGTANPAASWSNLVMRNGWTVLGGYGPAQARLNPFGAVELRGTIRAGTIADNTNIFDLPWAAMTPSSSRLIRPAIGPTGAGSAGSSRLFNNGSASFYCYGLNAGGTTDVGLDGLSYYL